MKTLPFPLLLAEFPNIDSDHRWAMGLSFAVGFALAWWSKRSVRRGAPPIPARVLCLAPLAVFLFLVKLSLPITFDPIAAQQRGYKRDVEYERTTDALRTDLDRAMHDLDALNSTVSLLLFVGFLVAMSPIISWFVDRMDDRNWIHGGIRPSPFEKRPDDAAAHPADESSER